MAAFLGTNSRQEQPKEEAKSIFEDKALTKTSKRFSNEISHHSNFAIVL